MTLEERVARFGAALAGDARGAIAAAGEGSTSAKVAFARVQVTLPKCDAGGSVWGPFEAPASNVLHWLAYTGTTEVSVLRLGDFAFAFVPGEVVASLGVSWRAQLGGAIVTSLADDYVGYVESPDFVEKELGEAQRQYFGPSLAAVLVEGLLAADAATR